jgi:hypothetical protein
LVIGANVRPSCETFGIQCSCRMFLGLLAIIQM